MTREQPTVLVVCTANRGRSPMVAAMLADLAERKELGAAVHVESAGLCAHELGRVGMPADPLVVDVCAGHGIDLADHRVRALDRQMLDHADLVIVMEGWQRQVLHTAFPDVASRVVTLPALAGDTETSDLADTALRPASDVEDTFAAVQRYLEQSWDEIVSRLGGSGLSSE